MSIVNRSLGRKMARKYHRSTCTVKRRVNDVWTTVASNVPVNIWDSSDRPPRPDGYDSGSDNIRTWNLSFIHGFDIRMGDQIHGATSVDGDTLPILTISTDFTGDVETSHWVVATAEDSAVAKDLITFYREVAGVLESSGPYPCHVEWKDITGVDPDNLAGVAHKTLVILTGPGDMVVGHGDMVSDIQGARGGVVVELRKEVGGRREVLVEVDTGYRR